MLLAIDIGNSNISVGVFELSANNAPNMVTNFKISTAHLSVDEYAVTFKDFLSRFDIFDNNFSQINCAAISSVVPSLTDIIFEVAKKICGKDPFVINSGIRTGFEIKIKNPEQLGTDIVCNCAAAIEKTKNATVILDMGTATTITVIDKKLTILGTIIIPGLRVSLDALYNSAAQLSDIAIDRNIELIGKDTKSAVSSGIINGNALMIDGFVRNIRESLDTDAKLSLIATGGLCGYVLPYLRNKFDFDEFLTLRGLALLYQKNNKL